MNGLLLAYLDAGTGTYLLTAIVGGFAGTMVAVRMWGRRVLNKVGLRRSTPQKLSADPPVAADQEKVAADQEK